MKEFGTASFITATNKVNGLSSILPYTFIILVLVCALMHFVLRYTIFGRGIYAIGGNALSAHTAGFNVKRTKFIMYIMIGVIASIGGICRVCMMQQCHPTNMLGMEDVYKRQTQMKGIIFCNDSRNVHMISPAF